MFYIKEAEVTFYPEKSQTEKIRCELVDTIPKKMRGANEYRSTDPRLWNIFYILNSLAKIFLDEKYENTSRYNLSKQKKENY